MPQLRHIDKSPGNLVDFVEEIADGLKALYGSEAALHYRGTALAQLRTAIGHPAVDTVACMAGDRALGMLMSLQRGYVAQISFLHILAPFVGQGIEQRLVTEAVQTYRGGGVDAILAEHVAFCPVAVQGAYRDLGFETIERELLIASLDDAALSPSACTLSAPLDESAYPEAADIIVDAYRDSPGRKLHVEVRDAENARTFIEAVAAGSYGLTRPDFIRGISQDGALLGVILGCETVPKVGFVLQVSVRPRYHNQGLGAGLVRALALAFCEASYERIALGVTVANPARRLYRRLGFQVLKPVNAHVWWRPR